MLQLLPKHKPRESTEERTANSTRESGEGSTKGADVKLSLEGQGGGEVFAGQALGEKGIQASRGNHRGAQQPGAHG